MSEKCRLMTLLLIMSGIIALSGCGGNAVMRDFCSKFDYQPKSQEFVEWVVRNMPQHLKVEFYPDMGNEDVYVKYCP